jgi:hypothetical protein
MTVSMVDIPVLHSAEVAHLYPQVMLPIYQGIVTSHTPLPRKRGKVTLRGLYKVPLALKNPLQFLGSSNAGIPRLTAIATKLSAFRPRAVPGPTSKIVAACPSPDGLARDGTQGGRTAARVILRPGRMRLQ